MEKFIEKNLLSSDDEKPIKNKKKVLTKKTKKVVKKSDYSSSSGDDKDHKRPKKITKKVTSKDTPKKTLVEGDDFKKLQKAKKLGAKYLDYSKRKNNKYVLEYKGKKIHFGSTKYEDYLIHKDLDRREKYLAKAKKITNKNGNFTYESPSYPNYWSVKLLN